MDVQKATFAFLVSWFLWLAMLSVFNGTRIGHALLYYSLLLMLIFVLASEYKTLGPIFSNLQTVGELDASIGQAASTPSTPTMPPKKAGTF
jgi:hypothetical protein